MLWERPPLPKGPAYKTFGLLGLLAAVYLLALALFKGLPQRSADVEPILGLFLAWFGLAASAWGFAFFAIAGRYVWSNPPRPAKYPGLTTGALFLGFLALLSFTR